MTFWWLMTEPLFLLLFFFRRIEFLTVKGVALHRRVVKLFRHCGVLKHCVKQSHALSQALFSRVEDTTLHYWILGRYVQCTCNTLYIRINKSNLLDQQENYCLHRTFQEAKAFKIFVIQNDQYFSSKRRAEMSGD